MNPRRVLCDTTLEMWATDINWCRVVRVLCNLAGFPWIHEHQMLLEELQMGLNGWRKYQAWLSIHGIPGEQVLVLGTWWICKIPRGLALLSRACSPILAYSASKCTTLISQGTRCVEVQSIQSQKNNRRGRRDWRDLSMRRFRFLANHCLLNHCLHVSLYLYYLDPFWSGGIYFYFELLWVALNWEN